MRVASTAHVQHNHDDVIDSLNAGVATSETRNGRKLAETTREGYRKDIRFLRKYVRSGHTVKDLPISFVEARRARAEPD